MTRFQQVFMLLLALVLAHPASAQEAEYVLGEIVVKSDKPGVEDVTNVAEVTAEDIEMRGATTLNEAIEMLPGVYIRTAADGTPRIDVRGFRTRHIKLLINGTPFQSTYDGQFDPASIPAENIARIVLTKGASSVLYGAGGTAAVINIITKGGEQGMHGSVGVRAGEVDSYLGKASLSGGSEKGFFFGSVSSLNSGAYPISDDFDRNAAQDSDKRENSDRDRDSAFFNGGYNISDSTKLGAVFSYSGGSYGKPPSVITDSKDPFGKTAKYERLEDYSEVGTQFNLRHEFDFPLSLDTAVYANQRNELTKTFKDDTYDAINGKSRSTSSVAGASLRASYDFDVLGVLTTALNGENQSWDESGFSTNTKGKKTDIGVNQDLQEYSAGLEYTITPIDQVTLVAGGSYVAQTGPESETATDWTYLLGASYRPFEGTTLSANHARKVRFASVRNLFDSASGNPDLEPEVAKHFEIGLTQELPFKTIFSGSVYRIEAQDMIEKVATPTILEPKKETYTNFEEYLFHGFEVGLENTFFDSLWIRTAYNYLDSEDKSDGSERDELQYRPRDTVSLEGKYTCPFGTTLYAGLQYVANQYTYNDDATLKKRMDDFTLVDLKLSHAFLEKALSVYAGVNNLFDEDYEESYGFPRPGRTLYCGIDYVF
ncbi:TonB-dependent receptor plug domain-containing protein [Desulfomicrobium salsuginis]